MKITIKDIKEGQGGWKTFWTTDGKMYSLPPEKGLVEVGKSYDIKYVWKEKEGKNRCYVTEILNGVEKEPKQMDLPTNGKDSANVRMNAMNNSWAWAIALLEAHVENHKITNTAIDFTQVKNIIKTEQENIYKQIMRIHAGGTYEEEVPF